MTEKEIHEKARAIAQEHEKYTEDCRINLHLEGKSEVDVARETAYAAAMEMGDWLLSHQWVSVEDELPPPAKIVLVKTKYDGYSTAQYSARFEDFLCGAVAIANITHWMPIPPLTEEGGEKK